MRFNRISLVCFFMIGTLGLLSGGWNPAFSHSSLLKDPPPPTPEIPKNFDDSVRLSAGVLEAVSADANNFGYTLENRTFNWIDAAANGTKLETPFGDNLGDEFGVEVDIGFSFPFFENNYSKVIVSTNGILRFGELGVFDFFNQPIPLDPAPNNLVAPFWDDLFVGQTNIDPNTVVEGAVHVYNDVIGSQQALVVEWKDVVQITKTDLLTFEVMLFESGDIAFQYMDLNGDLTSATVGIEDENGVDGLNHIYNEPGLQEGTAVTIRRPPPGPRVKVLSTYQSDFAVNERATFKVPFRNTGESGQDTFDLTLSNTTWDVQLYREDGLIKLTDTDGDNVIDTGSVGQGDTVVVTVKFNAPKDASNGDTTAVDLTAASSKNPAKQATTQIQAAVPAPFAQAYYDILPGFSVDLIWRHTRVASQAGGGVFTGSNLAFAPLTSESYIYAWTRNGVNTDVTPPVLFTNLEFILADFFGFTTQGILQITDNQDVTTETRDSVFALSSSPNGRIGIVWTRELGRLFEGTSNQEKKFNHNIYFAIIEPDGSFVLNETKVTNNNDWRGSQDQNVPWFFAPDITATDDNHFILTWVDDQLRSGGKTSDIYYAVYDTNGNQVKGMQRLTNSTPGGNLYVDPTLSDLAGTNQTNPAGFLGYTTEDPNTGPKNVAFAVIQGSNGNVVNNETPVPGTMGGPNPDAVQLSSGNILFAWNDEISGKTEFVLIDGVSGGYNFINAVTGLTSPKGRFPSPVSITWDKDGHGILTWFDISWQDHLFYALIDSDGNIVTQPMIYRTGLTTDSPTVFTSTLGQANAPYEGTFQHFLPVKSR